MKFTLDNAPQYGRHYDEEGFWAKLRRAGTAMGAKVLYPALQLYYLMQSPAVKLADKALIVGALGYLILPADLVPDIIPLMGFTDDLTALMLVLRTVEKHLTPDIKARARAEAERLTAGKTGKQPCA